MALWYWFGGVAGAGMIAVAGGNLYADQQLKKFYQDVEVKEPNKMVSLQIKDLQLGIMGGHADYVLTFQNDPCQPEEKYEFQIHDQIQRKVTGYQIDSRVTLPKELNDKLKIYFADKPPVSLRTKLNWLGVPHTTLSSPAINYQKDDFYLQSKGAVLQFNIDRKDKELLKNFKLELPSFILRDDRNYFALDQLLLSIDQYHPEKLQLESTSILTLNHLKFKSYAIQPVSLNLEQIKGLSHSFIKSGKAHFDNSFEVGTVRLADTEKTGKVNFNLNIRDVDAASFQNFVNEISRMQQQCEIDPNKRDKEFRAILPIFSHGFRIESKNNFMAFNDQSSLKTSFEVKFPKGQYQDMDSLGQAVVNATHVTGDLETTRLFIKDVMSLGSNMQANADDQMVDLMISNMQSQGRIKVNGNTLTSKFVYQGGQPRFIN